MKKKIELKVTIEYETEYCKPIDKVSLHEDIKGMLTDYLDIIHRDHWSHMGIHEVIVEDYESKTV